MNEVTLLMFGAAVSFIAFAGAYVILRERYLNNEVPRTLELPSAPTGELPPAPVPVRNPR